MTDVLFVDIDGTLLTIKDGRQHVPPSAMAALTAARERGALVFLCTGRSLADARFVARLCRQTDGAGLLARSTLPFDGIIGASGGVVALGDEILFHRTLGVSDVTELEAFMQDHGAHYYLESNEGIFFDDVFMDYARREWGIAHEHGWDAIARPLEEANRTHVNKLCFRAWDADLRFAEVAEEFGERFYLVPISRGDSSVIAGEISCQGVSKATGIRVLLEHLALGDVRTYGFGDSANDIQMLDACDEAIVMGDARDPNVHDHATHVTSAVLDDGIARAIAHFGLAPAYP